MTDNENSMCASACRLAYFLKNGGPPNVVMQECNLMVRFVASHAGPETVRTWLDEFVTQLAADLATPDGAGECKACRGLGRRFTADGRNPHCQKCAGTGYCADGR